MLQDLYCPGSLQQQRGQLGRDILQPLNTLDQ